VGGFDRGTSRVARLPHKKEVATASEEIRRPSSQEPQKHIKFKLGGGGARKENSPSRNIRQAYPPQGEPSWSPKTKEKVEEKEAKIKDDPKLRAWERNTHGKKGGKDLRRGGQPRQKGKKNVPVPAREKTLFLSGVEKSGRWPGGLATEGGDRKQYCGGLTKAKPATGEKLDV